MNPPHFQLQYERQQQLSNGLQLFADELIKPLTKLHLFLRLHFLLIYVHALMHQ
jgi:hypothetical protein